MVDGHILLKCFQFSELETCESTVLPQTCVLVLIECVAEAYEDLKLSSIEKSTGKFEEMGEIAVEIYRRTAAIKSSVGEMKTFNFSEPRAVHEKALKGQAKSHSTKWVQLVHHI
jgi:hypothetical protein